MNRVKKCLMTLTLFAAMLFAVPFPAYASESVNELELSLTIPEWHIVTLKKYGNGSVEVIDGNQDGDTAEVERHTSQSYKIMPDDGYVIDKVYYNGKSVTAQVVDGIFVAPEIDVDAVLEVTFKENTVVSDNTDSAAETVTSTAASDSSKTAVGSSPKTGDKSPTGWLILLAVAVVVWDGTWSASKRRQKK